MKFDAVNKETDCKSLIVESCQGILVQSNSTDRH
jgi:hypothetical protein